MTTNLLVNGLNRYGGRDFSSDVSPHPVADHVQSQVVIDEQIVFIVVTHPPDVAESDADGMHPTKLAQARGGAVGRDQHFSADIPQKASYNVLRVGRNTRSLSLDASPAASARA